LKQNLQARLQSQIDDVIGNVDRLPSLDDRANMPLVEATLLELMRYHTVAPLSVPRETACDVEVCGYFIPKGAMVSYFRVLVYRTFFGLLL
jgi:cytochrome P450